MIEVASRARPAAILTLWVFAESKRKLSATFLAAHCLPPLALVPGDTTLLQPLAAKWLG